MYSPPSPILRFDNFEYPEGTQRPSTASSPPRWCARRSPPAVATSTPSSPPASSLDVAATPRWSSSSSTGLVPPSAPFPAFTPGPTLSTPSRSRQSEDDHRASINSHHNILNLPRPVSYSPVIFCLPIKNHKCVPDSFFCMLFTDYISCASINYNEMYPAADVSQWRLFSKCCC